jgi:hypothetical protein
MLPSVFSKPVVDHLIERINNLTVDSKPLWGKMNVAQMLAHCNVPYDMMYTDIYPKAGPIKRLFLNLFAKNAVVSEKPYPKNSPTAPQFVIVGERNFTIEKEKLINQIEKTLQLGEKYFDGKESLSFGKLSIKEWNNLMYKHLDHHLSQFGV